MDYFRMGIMSFAFVKHKAEEPWKAAAPDQVFSLIQQPFIVCLFSTSRSERQRLFSIDPPSAAVETLLME